MQSLILLPKEVQRQMTRHPGGGLSQPTLPTAAAMFHRGGSWHDLPLFLRSAHRGINDPRDRSGKGFRVARTLVVRRGLSPQPDDDDGAQQALTGRRPEAS